MAEQPGAGHLDPETLAAYVDGLLPPEERARVDAEIAADPESYEWLVNTVNAVQDIDMTGVGHDAPSAMPASQPVSGPARVVPFHRRGGVMVGVGVLLSAAAAAVFVVRLQPGWWQGLWGPSADPRFARLVEAVGEERYFEARLTGGFKYGPLRPVMRGASNATESPALLSVALALQQEAAGGGIAARHAAAVAKVLVGGEALSDGIAALEEVIAQEPSASLRSDLAAAYLARYRTTGVADDATRAADQAATAVAAAPDMPEARFNLALALEAAARPQEARDAWQAFLVRAPDDGWASEARRHLDALTAAGAER